MSWQKFNANLGNIEAGWRGLAATVVLVTLLMGALFLLIGLLSVAPWVGLSVAVVVLIVMTIVGSR